MPKFLTKERVKEILIDVNLRAKNVYRMKMSNLMQSHEMEPLLIETLAYDFAYMDYGI